MPNAILAATPPRRISSASTKKDNEILSSLSATSESANRPGKVIKWSVAMDPVIRTATLADLTCQRLEISHAGVEPGSRCRFAATIS